MSPKKRQLTGRAHVSTAAANGSATWEASPVRISGRTFPVATLWAASVDSPPKQMPLLTSRLHVVAKMRRRFHCCSTENSILYVGANKNNKDYEHCDMMLFDFLAE
ncbi:hypothetical protein cyc_08094 [Cyclospora cayetanensis]|uniref:Uncharacterized protein n=1 Tax=Cyclospora cayetanensis TaxID=88456 RepID=A0A1D3CTL8_9EIME|nr:hypothetical protein cyc_08094 [Cyclospora cayetanensis]